MVSQAKLDPSRRSDPGVHFPWNEFKDLALDDTGFDLFGAIFMLTRLLSHPPLGLSRKREGTPKEKKERKTAQDCLHIIITWFPAVWGLLFLGLLFF